MPKNINSGEPRALFESFGVNFVLMGLFAIQHTIMARPAFKSWWTQYIPEAAERSTYVLATNLLMIGMFYLWEPVGGTVWEATQGWTVAIMYTGFALGWG